MRRSASAVLLLALAAACGGDGKAPAGDPVTLARERASAHFQKDRKDLARAELAPLVLRADAAAEDLVRAAAVEIADGKHEAAAKLLERAARSDPSSPAVPFLQGQIRRDLGDFEGALPLLRRAHELAPGDLPARLSLASAEHEIGNLARAEELFRSVIEAGPENGTIWYVSAVYQMGRLLTLSGREAEAERYYDLRREMDKRQIRAPDPVTMALGVLGRVAPPRPSRTEVGKPAAPPAFRAEPAILPGLGGARGLFAWDMDGDLKPDLAAVGEKGALVAVRRGTGYEVETVAAGPVALALPVDVNNSGDLELVLWGEGGFGLHAFDPKASRWSRSELAFPPLPSPPADGVAVDYDHEGDMDLLVVGAFGARVWRNDGADKPAEGGKLTDASEEAKLPADRAFDWCVAEDLDGDNDVDFLLGGRGGIFLADNLRAGRFADRSRAFPEGTAIAGRPVVADLDGDARPDLWTPRGVWRQGKDGSFALEPRAAEAGPALAAADLDLDGSLDVVAGGEAILAAGLPGETGSPIAPALPSGPLATADLDGDHAVDLAVSTQRGVEILRGIPGGNRGVRLSWRGARDNRRAVGAVVELRAGPIYRRIYWRGEPVLAGLGRAPRMDVLRVTWPNGTVNTEIDRDLTEFAGVDDLDKAFENMTQPSGQAGSCPFLYAFDGERYVFVSDVLGITPLGLPIAPGRLVPPDHDEYVLVRGDQLAPKEGFLEIALTEELREVTYLDRVRLLAVDHPAGSEILPNERFCFPPFPEARIHSVEAPLAPLRATGSDGADWTAELAAVDDDHALPFELLPPQFAGMTKPWYVELEFDREAVARAPLLRLLCTGWLYWSDASANMAAARTPGVAFVPPILQVPDGPPGSSAWRDAGPPVGFPAGKTKTMVLDVTGILRRDDPRIRVACTLRLHWDAIRLAVDADSAVREVRALEPSSARLWRRGFSALLPGSGAGEPGGQIPERFDWMVLAEEPRWDPHPGMYTRTGECLPLLEAVDDRFAILGAGDALTIRFFAGALPSPREGFARDWLVFLDGWAKDRDPNTIEALEVEPLPFHGMSGYPYGPGERFPDDEAHRRWRAEWNTRPAQRWIVPVSPRREAEWLLGG